MTTEPNRVDAGVPTGGQFAAKIKSDNVPSLAAPARRPELEGWPESLPEPEVDVQVGEGGTISTLVKVNGEEVFDIWNPADDIHDTESDDFENSAVPEDVYDAAKAWAYTKHNAMAGAIREEQRAAFERARARVIAKATGERREVTTAELNEFRDNSLKASTQADEDLELSSVALSARAILEDHPTAAFADLQVGSWDNGDFVSGASVSDAEGNLLYEYVETDGATDQEENDNYVVDTLRTLGANAEQSHWASAFSTGSYGDELFTIDLRKAAAWAPGDEA
ncbi:hypothetical protein [Pseudarthrobacter sp. BIM B-2242]|uniref:hypothetical protein n=1 Tax=Pseudarthrobacter sp. BIM B-2242 TaxID=2772401 RepID=UPI00168A73EC|nr:hypothetical protein [Pseudarthrobacter sp. BIM B-2242]QOD05780.1 hypothetical protein IDT60_22350 [Pseudarthrobacter sp. BIM B-2242]